MNFFVNSLGSIMDSDVLLCIPFAMVKFNRYEHP